MHLGDVDLPTSHWDGMPLLASDITHGGKVPKLKQASQQGGSTRGGEEHP